MPRQHNEQPAPADATSSEQDALEIPSERQGGDPAGDWRRERWATKYNKQWGAIINAWAKLLTASNEEMCTVRAFGLRDEEGVDAVFTISKVTAWSRPGHAHPYFDRTS